MKKIILLIVMVLTFAVGNGEDLKLSPKLEMGILENGLTYYMYPNNKPEGKSSLHLVIKAGSLQEDEDQLGLAHFIEHMAFNGTTNYPENELVKYLQSTGMKFGADLNAHTGFDETVYKLQVSTDDSEELEKAFEILREWATEITFLPQDVEDEKNVILEEWRLRQGLRQRISDEQKKAVFGDSRYSERFPIGDPDIIKNTNADVLKRYYNKWYVPENMAVIAVGDFDKEEVEGYINTYFNFKGNKLPKDKEYRLGKGNNEIYVFTDPEITRTSFDMIIKDDRKPITTKQDYREYIIGQMFSGIIENRYLWETKGSDPEFREGYSYEFSIGKKDKIHILGALAREDDMEVGIAATLRYLKTMANFDVSKTELAGAKASLYKSLVDMVNNRDSVENEKFMAELKTLHLEGEIFAEIDYQFEAFLELVGTISEKDIREYAKKLYENENVGYFLTAPEGNGHVPSRERIREIIDGVKGEEAVEYEVDLDNIVLDVPQIERGEILETIKEEYDTRYILENGIEVIVKDTPYDKDKINIKFFMDGGSSNLSKERFIASQFIDVIPISGVGNLDSIRIDAFLQDKNLSITPYMDDYNHGINIRTIGKDLETTMQLNYLLLTDPNLDETILKNSIELTREEVLNRGNSPITLYRDKVQEVVSNDNPRRRPLTIEELDTISPENVLESFKDVYQNFNGAKVVIVGSLDEHPIEELIETYIATLPSKDEKVESKDLGIRLPEGEVVEDVIKGVDKKVAVTIVYPYRDEYIYRDRVLYMASAQVLNNIMLEDVREKIGGVYSIFGNALLSPLAKTENHLTIRYTTDPAREREVTEAVRRSVKKLIEGDYPNRMIDNTVKNYKFNYSDMLMKNDFWMSFLYRREAYGDSFDIMTPEDYGKIVTRKNIESFVKNAIDLDNSLEIKLIPERAE